MLDYLPHLVYKQKGKIARTTSNTWWKSINLLQTKLLVNINMIHLREISEWRGTINNWFSHPEARPVIRIFALNHHAVVSVIFYSLNTHEAMTIELRWYIPPRISAEFWAELSYGKLYTYSSFTATFPLGISSKQLNQLYGVKTEWHQSFEIGSWADIEFLVNN